MQMIKSVTAREIFVQVLEVKKQLWGGEFWGKGYFINTVGQYSNETVIAAHLQNRGGQGEYRQIHKGQLELGLF
jgi:putative transposase